MLFRSREEAPAAARFRAASVRSWHLPRHRCFNSSRMQWNPTRRHLHRQAVPDKNEPGPHALCTGARPTNSRSLNYRSSAHATRDHDDQVNDQEHRAGGQVGSESPVNCLGDGPIPVRLAHAVLLAHGKRAWSLRNQHKDQARSVLRATESTEQQRRWSAAARRMPGTATQPGRPR